MVPRTSIQIIKQKKHNIIVMYNAAGIILSIILLLIGNNSLFASNGYKPRIVEPITETWRWHNFPELSGRGCMCMIEEKNGVLWFGVNGGILRYDGLNWNFFSITKDSANIPVTALCLTNNGSIYTGTHKGIGRLKDGKWKAIPLNLDFGDTSYFPHNRFPIIEASDKSILVGTRQGVVRIKDDQITLHREKEVFTGLGNNKGNDNNLRTLDAFDVYSIQEEKPGKVWLALRDGRIFICEFKEKDKNTLFSWKRVDTEPGYKRAKFPIIKIMSTRQIFIISGENDGGINISDGKKWTHFKGKQHFPIDDIYADIIELKDGSICVSGIGRVLILKDNVWHMYQRPALPFPSNRLRLFQTIGNNLWIIGLSNDVWRIDLSNQKWVTYRELNFKAQDKDGGKWFITVKGTIVKSDSTMRYWTEYNQDDGLIDNPMSIIVCRNGNVWATGSHNHTAATAFFYGKRWIKQLLPKLSWGIDRRAAFEAGDGSLWFGSSSDVNFSKGQFGGLVEYRNVKESDISGLSIIYHHKDEGLSLEGIYGIGQTSDGMMWAGQLGFFCFKPGSKKWEKIIEPVDLNRNFIDCIYSSKDGNIWVGTRTSGLFVLKSETGKWKHFTTENGLSSNTILNIVAVPNGNIWVATDRGISYFDGTSWIENAFQGSVTLLMDGISMKSEKDGSLWVNQNPPSWYRLALYDEDFAKISYNDFKTTCYKQDKLPPETVITFSQEKIAQPGNVILSWSGNDPWKFTPNNQIQYSYRIDNDQWSPYNNKTNNIFLSLANGYHSFEVRARDLDMNVDPTPASVTFYVIPPTWEQPWFIGLILAFLSIIVSFIVYLYHRNQIIQEMSEMKVRLFANISHELRTPLTLIMGPLAKILESSSLDDGLSRALNLINRNCHRLLRLTNQVLDFRKMEAGQLKFEPVKKDIIEFLKEENIIFNELAESKKINLLFETEIEKLEMWFDADKIEKIMFNLLSNALKFTPQNGTVTVHIEQIKCKKNYTINMDSHIHIKFDSWLEIFVRDTGIGISENDIDKVFNRFYQVPAHSVTAVGGTGVGLSVAKEMAKIHFGDLYVESEEGKGSTFKFKIPVITQDFYDEDTVKELLNRSKPLKIKFPGKESEEEPASSNNQNKEKSKILIVEDNTEMRRYIRGELENKYEIFESANGEEGLEKAINLGPDLIISDIMMPQMDGIEFCNRIKTDEQTSHIAVVLLTAKTAQRDKIVGLENGADDYLTKPFYSDELLLRIHNILETKKRLRDKYSKSLHIGPSNIEVTSVDQKFMKRAIEIVEEHLEDPDFSVEIFSRLIGMSRVGLYNKLKSLTNHSVQEFIFAIRLKRAAQLLKESGLSVTEIAYQVGFKDPSHFSKLFKKQFAVSPKAYAKEQNEQSV